MDKEGSKTLHYPSKHLGIWLQFIPSITDIHGMCISYASTMVSLLFAAGIFVNLLYLDASFLWPLAVFALCIGGVARYLPPHHKLIVKKIVTSLPATDMHPKPILCIAAQYYLVHQSTRY